MLKNNKPRFEEKDLKYLIGVCSFGNFFKTGQIAELWAEFNTYKESIPNKKNPSACMGLEFYTNRFEKDQTWFYMPAFEVENLNEIPPQFTAKILPASMYAIFTHLGPFQELGQSFQQIYKEWLPNSGYSIAHNFDFEYYDERSTPKDGLSPEVDIYIPIVKSK